MVVNRILTLSLDANGIPIVPGCHHTTPEGEEGLYQSYGAVRRHPRGTNWYHPAYASLMVDEIMSAGEDDKIARCVVAADERDMLVIDKTGSAKTLKAYATAGGRWLIRDSKGDPTITGSMALLTLDVAQRSPAADGLSVDILTTPAKPVR